MTVWLIPFATKAITFVFTYVVIEECVVYTDCPTLRLTQVGTLNHSTTTPFLIKGVALILRHTFNQSLIIIIIIIIIKEDSCK